MNPLQILLLLLVQCVYFDIMTSKVMTADYVTRFKNVGQLYGPDSLSKLCSSHILVIGLGGVGSWSVEALARSGIESFTLVDADDICTSNVNRQIQALSSTVGKMKATGSIPFHTLTYLFLWIGNLI